MKGKHKKLEWVSFVIPLAMAYPFLTLIKKLIQHCYIFNMMKQIYLFAKSKTKRISLYPQWSFFCLFIGLSYCSSNLLAFCILFLHHTPFSWIIRDIGVWNWCAKLVRYAHHSRYKKGTSKTFSQHCTKQYPKLKSVFVS